MFEEVEDKSKIVPDENINSITEFCENIIHIYSNYHLYNRYVLQCVIDKLDVDYIEHENKYCEHPKFINYTPSYVAIFKTMKERLEILKK